MPPCVALSVCICGIIRRGSGSLLYIADIDGAILRTAGRSDARAYGYMPWIDSVTLGRSDARTHSGSLSHPMDSDGIGCARLRRSSSLSHTPAVYHACGWLWRAVAATMLAVAVIVACACVQSVRCYAVRWCPVCYARRCSAPAILAAGVVDACALLCLYPAAVSAAPGARTPGARTPCARTIGSIAPSGIGSSVGQWWQSLPVVFCYACSYLPGVMLASGGSLCRGDGLRYLQHIGGGASAAVSRSVYRSSGRRRAAFRGVCLLHLPAFFWSFS